MVYGILKATFPEDVGCHMRVCVWLRVLRHATVATESAMEVGTEAGRAGSSILKDSSYDKERPSTFSQDRSDHRIDIVASTQCLQYSIQKK